VCEEASDGIVCEEANFVKGSGFQGEMCTCVYEGQSDWSTRSATDQEGWHEVGLFQVQGVKSWLCVV
jgi:hypothetical protein